MRIFELSFFVTRNSSSSETAFFILFFHFLFFTYYYLIFYENFFLLLCLCVLMLSNTIARLCVNYLSICSPVANYVSMEGAYCHTNPPKPRRNRAEIDDETTRTDHENDEFGIRGDSPGTNSHSRQGGWYPPPF